MKPTRQSRPDAEPLVNAPVTSATGVIQQNGQKALPLRDSMLRRLERFNGLLDNVERLKRQLANDVLKGTGDLPSATPGLSRLEARAIKLANAMQTVQLEAEQLAPLLWDDRPRDETTGKLVERQPATRKPRQPVRHLTAGQWRKLKARQRKAK